MKYQPSILYNHYILTIVKCSFVIPKILCDFFFILQVFSLTTHQLLYTFAGEHARSSFFKHIGQGVTQIHIGMS